MLNGKRILVTGGTGSFGKNLVRHLLRAYPDVKRIVVFSRDELKQSQMARELSPERHRALRYFIGDVRDRDRLRLAFREIDIVVHAAALKQIDTAEYNPTECIRTNIGGSENVIAAALDSPTVERVLALSTDKACNPINLYGATKLCADKLFIAANSYVGRTDKRFSVVRYGNVIGSRGSVIPVFLAACAAGELPITDLRMTRFWITIEEAVRFVLARLADMQGGEIFVPKLASMKLVDLARALAPDCRVREIGIRPGEKLHEMMITADDARATLEFDDHYLIQPQFKFWRRDDHTARGGRPVPDRFAYASDTNDRWLTIDELRRLVEAERPRFAAE